MLFRAAAGAALVLAAALSAQNYSSSPGGFLSKEGDDNARFGQWPDSRLMFFDGEMRNQVLSLRGISYRRDMTSTDGSGGRSWAGVSLHISDCDMAKVSQTFSLNPTSTPTLVFSAPVTWPTLSAPTGSGPATFAYQFPFATPWLSAGRQDICIDYDFSGGTLANNQAWPTNVGLAYFMDGYITGDYGWGSSIYHGATGTGCIDSGTTSSRQGRMKVISYAYGPNYSTTSLRNKHQLYSNSYYTAANATVVHALGFGGSGTGTTFPGISCNKLFVDPTQPTLYFFTTAYASGSSGNVYPAGGQGLFPYIRSLVGIPLWFQGAWSDSQTQALKLTYAAQTALPAVPMSYRRSLLYHWDPRMKSRFGVGPYADGYINPIVRYTH